MNGNGKKVVTVAGLAGATAGIITLGTHLGFVREDRLAEALEKQAEEFSSQIAVLQEDVKRLTVEANTAKVQADVLLLFIENKEDHP